MLALDAVDAGYGRVQVLRGVSLHVGAGEIVALFGANGAGKTTTLRAISGLVRVTSGRIELDGAETTRSSPHRMASLGVAHIPEGRGIFPRMSVWQNLKMGAYAKRLAADALDERLDEVFDLFPRLRERVDQQAGTMSGGEQQMLAIARALVARPSVLMLDEPSHGLAPKLVHEVFETLAALRDRGTALLVVEQFATVALSVAQRAYVLERGRVVFDGAASDLAGDRHRLAGAYLGSGAAR